MVCYIDLFILDYIPLLGTLECKVQGNQVIKRARTESTVDKLYCLEVLGG